MSKFAPATQATCHKCEKPLHKDVGAGAHLVHPDGFIDCRTDGIFLQM